MKKNQFLKGFFKDRIEQVFDTQVRKNLQYQKATKVAQKQLVRLERMNLTKEQATQIDSVIAAYNYLGSVYGWEAYKHGLWDGVRLVILLHKGIGR